jgi:hypothetical protein
MRSRTKAAIALSVVLGVVAMFALGSVDTREIGRSDPKSAANYRVPLRNFSETYTDGVALGISVGSAKAEAIAAAERGGFKVSPSGWGDSRAGASDLYEKRELLAMMLRQPYLIFDHAKDRTAMIVEFRGDHVAAVKVYYINFEAI